eukprot:gnl/Hemi2/1632_TR582_c0_g13_i1.p1 gnl/Hemi2/1632_TR582_c0_g13~~gnl/Hemi2/1632_TR582_c0_g13_i1.p1  ORF type:complete len:521 (-),score=88.10 gnl/Hemi2/1632_TR582_c0_g13_i1:146-1681(-)
MSGKAADDEDRHSVRSSSSTGYMPPAKRQKLREEEDAAAEETEVVVQFQTQEGELTGPQVMLRVGTTTDQLRLLLNSLLENSEKLPYSFYVNQVEIMTKLLDTMKATGSSPEQVVTIVYQPQSVFQVRAVTRCSSSLPGHEEAILTVKFSPDGTKLASGSGDTTVRIWDMTTETPQFVCTGHKNWVLAVDFSPDGLRLASGSKDAEIRIWDPATGLAIGGPLTGHTKYITSFCWEPLHSCTASSPPRLASSSKDNTVRVWDTVRGLCQFTIAGHTNSVAAVVWGGQDKIYTASHDRLIGVWNATNGAPIRTLNGHGHWVNTLALSTAYVLRTGAFDPLSNDHPTDPVAARALALKRYQDALSASGGLERLVSGADDFTLILWHPDRADKPVARLTGHQQLVNHVSFSPDGRYIASASFDKSVKVWDGLTGKFISSLRGHVGAVYQVAWSADSRLFVSASKDSTMKVFDPRAKKFKMDLPGHADEVYAVDWSPDGQRVASGSKDRILKLWRA